MATYYTSSSNQRDAVPMLCLREPLPNSYSETPILPSSMTLYMNSGSYSEAFSGNSQQQSNCFVIPSPSVGASHSTPEQQEILANMGGFQSDIHDLNAWREGRSEMLVRQPMDGQNLQGQGLLSLSLGTHIQMPSIHNRHHSSSFDSFLASQDLGRADFSFHEMSSVGRTVPSSKYLKAVQQLLDEVVDIRKAIKRPDMRINQTKGQRQNLDDGGVFPNDRLVAVGPTCQMSEVGRFKSGSGVSLTLGLQGGESHLSLVSMREDEIYSAAADSTVGVETAELECIGAGNQRQRFSSPHMFHDFVV
uniref:BEL1-like homeodomain protein 6 n=1 Tax=Cajanus cajan TaxID=3821 RepID=A0A151TD05_CAJCA|nr:BEL1-like homeodomain protein 6 [Cajanus cajan]